MPQTLRVHRAHGRLSRRQFLAMAGTAASASLLAACQPAAPPAPGVATSVPPPAPLATAGAPSAAAPATATQAPAAPAGGVVKRGGVLNALVPNDWVTMDPLFNSAEGNATNMIYGNWIGTNRDPSTGQLLPQPEMLSEWDLGSNDVTLKLQPGVRFHDGTAWDATAAKWNLDRMIFDPASQMKAFFSGLDVSGESKDDLARLNQTAAQTFDFASKAIEVVDSMTVKLHTQRPIAPIVLSLSDALQFNHPISPAAYLKQGKDAFGRNPVGAGPFKFTEWKPGSVVLARNPDYWKQGGDGQSLPYLDQIHYRFINDDTARLLELKSGTAHLSHLIQAKDLPGVSADSSLTLVQSANMGNNYRLIFDSTNRDGPFAGSKKLRQALLYALDRDAMAKTLGFSAGQGRKYLLAKGTFGYDESLAYYWFDQSKAQQLVKDAVAESPSAAGADGKVAVTLSVIDRAVDKQQSEMIKQMADGVGFNVTIETLDRVAWTAKLVKLPGQPGGKYDFATMRQSVSPDDPDEQWRRFFDSQGLFNVAHLADPAWDHLIDAAASTYDGAQRKAQYLQLEQMAFDQPWYGYLWQQNWNWVYSKKVQGFEPKDINDWWLAPTWLQQ